MSKSNHFTGQPVFSQLLNLLYKSKILKISRSTGKSERYVKQLDGYTHLVVMIYGVLNHFDSLRELETGMKVHTVMKYNIGVPMVVQLTSAAKHDHYLLKEVHLPKDSTLAMDRAYVDYAQFQRLTDEGVCYVTKMKKNLRYRALNSVTHISP